MLRRVAFVRNDFSEELTRATRRNIPEDTILASNTLDADLETAAVALQQ
jgi:hypothetical protein